MNRSLGLKLLFAFVVVGLASTVVLAVLAARATRGEFAQFMFSLRQGGLADELTAYYEQHQTWEGLPAPSSGMTLGMSRRMRGPGPEVVSYLLVDGNGRVVVPGPGHRVGDLVGPVALQNATPIEVNGQVVGQLVTQPGAFGVDPAESAFLRRINQLLVIGAVVGTGAAVLLGALLVRSLTRPLRELTDGARAVAAGQLDIQVPVRSADEMGELATAFNQMNANLARSRDLRRQMTADIAHELRTPLSIILGHSEAIQEGVLDPSPGNLQIIHEEAGRLERLVEDLRTLSLVEAGELPLDMGEVQPKTLLQAVAARYQAAAEQKQIDLQTEAPAALPAIQADHDRMIQVLGNLVHNALRHTPAGGRVTLSAGRQDGQLRIAVNDSGPGIDPQDLPHVFERFYRADKSRQRDGAGSGLGLAIAKSLVEAHGGRIWADSPPGQGTSMVVELPIPSQD